MSAWCLLALADDVLNLLANLLQVDTQGLKCLGRNALTLVDQTKQNVLGSDVVVVEQLRLFLGEHDYPASLVGEFLEQAGTSKSVLKMLGEQVVSF